MGQAHIRESVFSETIFSRFKLNSCNWNTQKLLRVYKQTQAKKCSILAQYRLNFRHWLHFNCYYYSWQDVGWNFCDGRAVSSIGARGATAWLPSAGYIGVGMHYPVIVHALGMYSPQDMELMETVPAAQQTIITMMSHLISLFSSSFSVCLRMHHNVGHKTTKCSVMFSTTDINFVPTKKVKYGPEWSVWTPSTYVYNLPLWTFIGHWLWVSL